MKPRARLALIQARKAVGKTQAQIADEVGISRASYTNIELGRKNPSLHIAQRIAKALGGTLDTCFPEGAFSDPQGCVRTQAVARAEQAATSA